jgi:polyhydroxyalkanoate synthesis regulator phasin
MKVNRWIALPVAGLAAIVLGVAAAQAAPSPSPSASGAKNYAQVFVDKLAAILHLNATQTRDALKQAEVQTVDQMLKDGKITQQQADAMKAKINARQGLGPIGGLRPGAFKADRALMHDLTTAAVSAAASALHMNAADFKAALKSGKSLTDLEAQQKVSDSAVKGAMKNAAKGVLDKAVKAGTITQAQADTLLSRVGSGLNFRPKLGHRGPGAPASPAPSPKPSGAAFYSTI